VTRQHLGASARLAEALSKSFARSNSIDPPQISWVSVHTLPFRPGGGYELSSKRSKDVESVAVVALIACLPRLALRALAQEKKPNIIFIMGDDIGWSNIGVYNQGIMAGRTPNLDRLGNEGMRFTDYYAEASCTAGRANFITGELPIRTGLTTVGQAGARLECPTRHLRSRRC
jgi:hypothetical protein